MSLLVSGFNCFGQFDEHINGKQKLQHFRELHLKSITNNEDNQDNVGINDDNHNNLIISCAWSYLCIAKGNVLYMRGLICGQMNFSKFLKANYTIKALATNDRFCLVLLENGKLFKVMLTNEAALQEIILTADHQLLPQKRSIFGEPKSFEPINIAFVDCGNNITVAISTTNIVFCGTTQIYQFPQHVNIKILHCGFEHAAVLTKNGDVYTWGNGLRGQLGQEVLRTEEYPTLVEALAGVKIISIAAGGWHMAALSVYGDLYTWGFNTNGQLGLKIYKSDSNLSRKIKEPSVYTFPQIIDLPICKCDTKNNEMENAENCTPIKVMAGARHTLVLNKCGNLYGSGWNTHGQLGLINEEEYCDHFQFILKIKNVTQFTQIFCGDWCTIIKMYSFFYNFLFFYLKCAFRIIAHF